MLTLFKLSWLDVAYETNYMHLLAGKIKETGQIFDSTFGGLVRPLFGGIYLTVQSYSQ
jgi:hypothetical protein